MKTYKNLFSQLCSYQNLENAYWKARENKSNKPSIKEFEKHWQLHLCELHKELISQSYRPLPLKTFILHDPKTRKICVSNFRDRIVHHALVNILQPIFDPRFIHDSYASRKGKGCLAALKRFDEFKRKASDNNTQTCYVLKADIKHYFETVNHSILIRILSAKIYDKKVLNLIKIILENYNTLNFGKGMPLGNWTSQYFANIYLNELDQFVKHKLHTKYYLRYVDDFVILNRDKKLLMYQLAKIRDYLYLLGLEIHPNKCKIAMMDSGIGFLGFRIFYHYKLIRVRNLQKIMTKIGQMINFYKIGEADISEIFASIEGWNAYATHGNTYRLRQRIMSDTQDRLTIETVHSCHQSRVYRADV